MTKAEIVEFNGVALNAQQVEALEAFRQMGFLIPEIEADGGIGIVMDIMNASTLEELDAAWEENNNDRLLNKPLLITQVRRGDSEYKDGLGLFLSVNATVIHSGEDVIFSTGSVSTVAQLVRAYTLKSYPFVAMLVKADKPSKNGYYPQHLVIEKDQSAAGK